ncbi:TPA: formylmethanofuran dehydrogenase [Thermoplasmata archaeon]|nr:formylmethanofuran dehydrogenase [Thermoplasmata archaeon]
MSDEEILGRISEFHGHLGPFVVVGYRMGEVANRLLGADAFAKTAIALTGGKPPRSCMIDGIQLSSGCTIGKGTIGVIDQGEVASIFLSKKGGRQVRISLRADRLEEITSTPHESMEGLARKLFSLKDDELFEVENED